MSRKPREYAEPTKRLHPLVYSLRKRRYEIGIPAREIAVKTGYGLTQIQEWERGRCNPSLQSLTDWAQALGVKVEIIKE